MTGSAPPRPRRRTAALCGVLSALLAAGCAAAPREPEQLRLARQYFADNNAAARRGPQAQQDFFHRTQHPDFADRTCDLDRTTVELDPALSTLRPDPGFTVDGTRPRGSPWVVAVEVTTRRDGSITGHQIGSQHLVLLNGSAYAFAPCPTEGR